LPEAPLSGFRLLVVEDDQDTQEALRAVFEMKGAAVTTAGSALEGFQSFLRLRPDVIVCDLGLPGADGYALIRQIRELPPVMGGSTAAGLEGAPVDGPSEQLRRSDGVCSAHGGQTMVGGHPEDPLSRPEGERE